MEPQKRTAGLQVRVVDLTVPAPDYAKALDEIFAAESVAVW